MDPLSITASAIACLQITGTVLSYCYEYRLSVKSAASESKKLTDEVVGLRDILEQLLHLSENEALKDPERFPALRALSKREGPLEACSNELLGLQKKLAPELGFRSVMQKLSWPFKEGDMRKSIESIERFKTTLSLALNADQTVLLLETRNEVVGLADAFTTFAQDLKSKEILKWLSAPNPYTNLSAALDKKEPGTGLWLLESPIVTRWKSEKGWLWLHGIPGCGKTVLCSTLIENLDYQCQYKPDYGLVYFYFDFADVEKLKLDSLLKASLLQLAASNDKAAELLKALHSTQPPGRPPKIPDLEECFYQIVKLHTTVYFVVDALDECHDRGLLLDFLERMNGWNLPGLRLFLSSRAEPDIEEALEPLIDSQISIGCAQIQHDVQLYVHNTLRSDRKLKKLTASLNQEIEDTLVKRSHGMFQWVVCQLSILKKCLTTKALLHALQSSPSSLNDTYDRILRLIDPSQQDNAVKILSWLTYSLRPVTVTEMAEVIAVQLDSLTFDPENRLLDPRDVLTICPGLVTISTIVTRKKTVDVLSLAHFSIKEYLTSTSLGRSSLSAYHLQKEAANHLIGKTSLTYLLETVKQPFSERMFADFPLALYAAEHWPRHVTHQDFKSDVGNMEIQLFSNEDFASQLASIV